MLYKSTFQQTISMQIYLFEHKFNQKLNITENIRQLFALPTCERCL